MQSLQLVCEKAVFEIYLTEVLGVVSPCDTGKLISFREFFFFFGSTKREFLPACKRGTCYGNVAGWVAVRHIRYCIKTAKPILKLFGPSGSPIIYAFMTPYADTKFKG